MIPLEQAIEFFAYLPRGVRGQASMKAIDGPEGMAVFVQQALSQVPALQVSETGDITRAEAPSGDADAKFARLAKLLDTKPGAKVTEKTLSKLLTDPERHEILVRTIYARGYALKVEVIKA